MRSSAYVVINPIFWMVLLVTLYFLLKTFHKNKLAKVFLYCFWGWLFLIYVSPLPQFLVAQLENQYPRFGHTMSTNEPLNILVLGGGVAEARIVEGVKIYNRIDNAKLIFSGSTKSKHASVAERMAGVAVNLRVNPRDTLVNNHPNNTEQEVEAYLKRFDAGWVLILVTSASHMPRAIANFNKANIQPIPAPTDFKVINDFGEIDYNFKPSIKKMQLMQIAMKEYAGLLWLKLSS